jgi:hypothetical protein
VCFRLPHRRCTGNEPKHERFAAALLQLLTQPTVFVRFCPMVGSLFSLGNECLSENTDAWNCDKTLALWIHVYTFKIVQIDECSLNTIKYYPG